MKNITKAVLVLSGASLYSLSSMGSVHTPAVKHRANPELVADYLDGHPWYNPYKSEKCWNRSENRKKEILGKINTIRDQIRAKAKQLQNSDPEEKLIQVCASNLVQKSRNEEAKLRRERAAALRTLPKFINYPVLMAKKAKVRIDFNDEIFA